MVVARGRGQGAVLPEHDDVEPLNAACDSRKQTLVEKSVNLTTAVAIGICVSMLIFTILNMLGQERYSRVHLHPFATDGPQPGVVTNVSQVIIQEKLDDVASQLAATAQQLSAIKQGSEQIHQHTEAIPTMLGQLGEVHQAAQHISGISEQVKQTSDTVKNLAEAVLQSTHSVDQSTSQAMTPVEDSRLARLPPAAALDDRRVRRGIVSRGDDRRVRRAVAKLLLGQPIIVAVVGGSISWGHGASAIGKTDWPSRTFAWVNACFPGAPHVFQNGAIPGTSSAYMARCVNWHVPATADIVVMEYATNDRFSGEAIELNFVRRSYERLARRLLRFPNRPAVLQLSSMPFRYRDPCCSMYWESAEDQQGVIAQYYGLPWLSLRAATWEARQRNESGYAFAEFLGEDKIHPIDRGHQMLADLVTGYLASVAEELVRRPFSDAEKAALEQPLLLPMIPGNEAHEGDNCVMDEEFHKFVTHTEGFEWIVEGGQDGHRPKPGFIANTTGSSLRFVINSAATAAPPAGALPEGAAPLQTVLMLSYLASYEHMGQAEVRCITGCTCDATTLNGHWDKHESQLQGHLFSASQHPACEVEVRVLEATSSGERKVKLTGVVMSDDGAGMRHDVGVVKLDAEKGFSRAANRRPD